ncbi:aminodeoxychorismate synthase component I [Telmatospirillum sp. J64-1]|uniref:aminodeoxychorismate synthase component I n=1 Tax=Telmatospirillum sp. J64-1 TaxID=2502183 RepID=UPI00115EB095|nr:aminodeoxychorismate synthase component I [Telmatospirillum sp. J64-1]
MTRVFSLPYGDPLAAFAPFAEEDFALLLDSAANDGGRGRYSYLCLRPRHVLTLKDHADPLGMLAQVLDGMGKVPAQPDLPPFQGGVAGFLSYDLGRSLERLPALQPDDLGFPDLCLGVFPAVAAWDHERRQAWVLGEKEAAKELCELLEPQAPPLDAPDWGPRLPWRAELDRESYLNQIGRVVSYIFAGDIFQANLSQRFLATLPPELTPFGLYRRLRALSPAPFAAYLRYKDISLVSASPERFLRCFSDGLVETRPIKGTRPRSPDPAEDARQAEALSRSGKDLAENLMIVDLLRNDLARVCRPGSVVVPELFTLESFASVHHLVSAVEGRLRPGLGAVDLLRATFPGGSITGAPKIRAMEIIEELETARRGPYCGSMIWIGRDGAMDSSILIRTMAIHGDRIAVQAGGGIVAESDPHAEWEETMVKARAMLASLEGRGQE